MGAFDHNKAKSNWDNGLKIKNYRSSVDDVVISNVKAFKNRQTGFAIYDSYSARIQNVLLAENSIHNIDMRLLDYIHIQDATIKGYTPETKSLINSPYFAKPCISYFFSSPIGLKLPTETYWGDQSDKKGANLTNVRFTDFDHSDECAASIPITFYAGDNLNGHFDFSTVFKNVTTDGRRIIDAASSDDLGVKDIIIYDSSGSTDPSGQATSRAGVLVSNKPWMKAFAGEHCANYPLEISYCATDNCFRTIRFSVDLMSSVDDLAVRVTRESDGKSTVLPYMHDENVDLQYFSGNLGFFSASLPPGSYQIEFLEDFWRQVWPTFVLPNWNGVPGCKGFVSADNITFVEPRAQCEELVVNGDVESGLHGWRHSNGGNPTDGQIITVEGSGIDNSTALRYINRRRSSFGIGQNLDTRCLHQSLLGDYYEIQLSFRLEEGSKPFICNPSSNSFPDRCPEVLFYETWIEGEETSSRLTTERATVVVPNDFGDFDLIHGVLQIDETLKSLDRLYLEFAYADKKFDIVVDNLSMKKLHLICTDNWIRNSNFEEGGKYWSRAGALTDIETSSSGKSIKVFNKSNKYDGVTQSLYLDKDCLRDRKRFEISGEIDGCLL